MFTPDSSAETFMEATKSSCVPNTPPRIEALPFHFLRQPHHLPSIALGDKSFFEIPGLSSISATLPGVRDRQAGDVQHISSRLHLAVEVFALSYRLSPSLFGVPVLQPKDSAYTRSTNTGDVPRGTFLLACYWPISAEEFTSSRFLAHPTNKGSGKVAG